MCILGPFDYYLNIFACILCVVTDYLNVTISNGPAQVCQDNIWAQNPFIFSFFLSLLVRSFAWRCLFEEEEGEEAEEEEEEDSVEEEEEDLGEEEGLEEEEVVEEDLTDSRIMVLQSMLLVRTLWFHIPDFLSRQLDLVCLVDAAITHSTHSVEQRSLGG